MDINTIPGKEQALARGRMRRMWQRAVGVLACVVVFVTTYALILPAITMEKEAICGFEEHSHGEACFDSTQTDVMLCTFPEHIHSNACRETPETTAPTETTEPTSATEPTAETIPQELTTPVIEAEGEGMAPVLAPIPETIIDEGYTSNAEGEENAIHWKVVEEDEGYRNLIVEGHGGIPDFSDQTINNRPWQNYANTWFSKIVIGDGITDTGAYSLKNINSSTIILGKDVNCIANQSFSYATHSWVVIPENVKKIENGAFIYGSLGEVIFRNGVETIEANAFPQGDKSNYYMYSVHLPASVKSVAGLAFWGVSGYTVDVDNPYLTAVDGVLYSKDMTVLMDYPTRKVAEEYVTPRTVVTIRENAVAGILNTKKCGSPPTCNICPQTDSLGTVECPICLKKSTLKTVCL